MHILIAAGGPTQSRIALEQCVAIAETSRVEATILSVVEIGEQDSKSEVTFAMAKERLTTVNSLQTKIRTGNRVEQIVTELQSNKYDLLILGDMRRHSLLSRLMGPTAQRVIGQSHHPVLLAKENGRALHHLLICESGIRTPNLLERFTAQLPELIDGAQEVTVLHVMSQISAGPGITGKDLRANASELIEAQTPEGEWLQYDLDVLREVKIEATPKIRHGLVVEEILAEATGGRYDLVVLGAHAQEGWQQLLLENVTTQIVLKVDLPVLVMS